MILYHETMTVELYKQLADLDEKCCNDNYTNKLSFVKIGTGKFGCRDEVFGLLHSPKAIT